MVGRIFKDLKVVEFTQGGVGPMIGRYLAIHGATVVRVESVTHPCLTRGVGPFSTSAHGPDRSVWYAILNPNKHSMALNLNHPKGPAIAKRLAAWADVLIESFAPGVMRRWGLHYEAVRETNPDIIMVSTSNLGQTGPWGRQPGHGLVLVGFSGWTSATGWPDRPPVQPYGAYSDYLAPRLGMAGTVAALDYRRRTGKGSYLDLSQLECSLQYMAPSLLDYSANGRVAQRMGNRSTSAAPHGVYACQGEDRWCAIAVETEQEWLQFCRAIAEPEIANDPRFCTLSRRKENEDQLDWLVGEWTKAKRAEQVMWELQSAGVPAAVVETPADLLDDPQLKSRGFFVEVEDTERGLHAYQTSPFVFSRSPEHLQRAPRLGEHTEAVCREMLGMPDDEFVANLKAGVFE